jgi:hypothetical protein
MVGGGEKRDEDRHPQHAACIPSGARPRVKAQWFSRADFGVLPAPGMPLYSCPICGWTTTASLAQAARAHGLGVPDCEGTLDQVAYAGRPTGQTVGASAGSGGDTESDSGGPASA